MNKIRKKWPSAVVMYLLAVLAPALLVTCQANDGRRASVLTDDTGVPVSPQFRAFYEAAGGPRVFGYPVSDAFQVSEAGPTMQYFQTLRLDYDALRPAGERITVFPLGEWAMPGLGSVDVYAPPENGHVRYFPETDFAVWGEFLTFYETYDGERLLGLPISSQLNEGGRRVQYFENGRLQWHPELPTEQRVQLGFLGQAHFDAEMVFAYQETTAGPLPSAGVTRVDVSAFVKAPILYAGEQQALYVTALRSDGKPVEGAQVEVVLAYGDQSQTLEPIQTDENGKVQMPLNITVPPGEQVKVQVTVRSAAGQELGSETTGFRTWW